MSMNEECLTNKIQFRYYGSATWSHHLKKLILGLVFLSAFSGQAKAETVATIDTSNLGRTVPARSIGISMEVQGIKRFPNSTLEQMVKNLTGPMRFGGGSASGVRLDTDYATPDGFLAVNQKQIDNVVAATRRIGTTISMPINMLRPSSSALKLVNAYELAGVDEVEMGNEPDLWVGQLKRPQGWTFGNNYAKEYALVASDIGKAFPSVQLVGPSICCTFSSGSLSNFANTQDVQKVTAHPYSTAFCDKTKPAPTAADLLSESRMSSLRNKYLIYPALTTKPIWWNELNSTGCGGSPGVSNSAASALWFLDYAMESFSAGVQGLQPHDAGSNYNVFDIGATGSNIATPRPIYYGMMAAKEAMGRTFVKVSKTSGTENLKIWGLTRPDGILIVYLINKEVAIDVPVTLNIPGKTGGAQVNTLGGAALSSTTGVKFGVNTVTPSGVFIRRNDGFISPSGSTYSLTVPVGKAVMLVIL